jgi:peptidyl-prolyl cis-trans isomerase C
MNRTTLISAFSAAALGLSAALWASQPLSAQESSEAEAQDAAESNQTSPDDVVARVDGTEISRAEVMTAAGELPPQYQAQIDQIFPMLVQRFVDLKLASNAGRAAGLEDDAEVQSRIADAREAVIREVYITREIDKRLTDEMVQQSYQDYLEQNPAKTEHHARHILVESEEEAIALIEQLDGGADFAELAKEKSTGPSATTGGDLGFFSEDQMVPEFSAATAAIEVGSHSAEPVQSQFGWHVIKVEDRRTAAQPSYTDLEPQLREQMTRQVVEQLLAELRDNAEVEILLPETQEESGAESGETGQSQ